MKTDKEKNFIALYQLMCEYPHNSSEPFEMFTDLYESDMSVALEYEREVKVFIKTGKLPSYVKDFLPKTDGHYLPSHSKDVYRLCLLGASQSQIAEFFDVGPQIIDKWAKLHPAFGSALRRGRMEADAKVAYSMFKRATGQVRLRKKKFATHEGVITDEKDYIEELAPDVSAAKFWLERRMPEQWKGSQDVNLQGDLSVHRDLSDDDLDLLLAQAGLQKPEDPLATMIVKTDEDE
jgi:hypothetical protein